jgi:hypothetical protein
MKKIVKANYKGDSKNFHKFLIDQKKGVTGSIYISKGEEIPDIVKVYLKTAGEKEKGTELPQARPHSSQLEET